MKSQERVDKCILICKALKEKDYQINIKLYSRLMKLIYRPTDANDNRENNNQKNKK